MINDLIMALFIWHHRTLMMRRRLGIGENPSGDPAD